MKLRNGREIFAIPSSKFLPDYKKERIQKWIDALRSGKYVQGRYSLRSDDGKSYCCLGVACDIAADEIGAKWVFSKRDDEYVFTGGKTNFDANFILPNELRNFYGMIDNRGFEVRTPGINIPEVLVGVSLPNLNDEMGATFEDIADILEISLQGGLDIRQQFPGCI